MPTVKNFFQNIKLNPDGTIQEPFLGFVKLLICDDNGIPSSSRLLAITIFWAVLSLLAALSGVLGWVMVHTHDKEIFTLCVQSLEALLWVFIILILSALSLYGIHVWKYLAQLRQGLVFNFNQPEGGVGEQKLESEPEPTNNTVEGVATPPSTSE